MLPYMVKEHLWFPRSHQHHIVIASSELPDCFPIRPLCLAKFSQLKSRVSEFIQNTENWERENHCYRLRIYTTIKTREPAQGRIRVEILHMRTLELMHMLGHSGVEALH